MELAQQAMFSPFCAYVCHVKASTKKNWLSLFRPISSNQSIRKIRLIVFILDVACLGVLRFKKGPFFLEI
jgi:hypothetical protein